MQEKKIRLIIMNAVVIFTALAIYFVVFLNLKIGVNHEIMFSTVDSKSYLDVANALKEGFLHSYTIKRPILYPLVLLVTLNTFGIFGLWLLQVFLWISTLLLIFWTIFRITKNYFLAYLIIVFVSCNLSLIALTLHALTEVSVTFLLAVLVFFIVHNIKKHKQLFFIYGCLTVLVLLTLIKPVFNIPLLIVLLVILPLLHFKTYFKTPIKLFPLIIILLPYFTQVAIMKIKYDTYNVSLVGEGTFSNYIFAQGMGEVENIDRNAAIKKAKTYSRSEQLGYILEHKSVFVSNYFENLEANIKANAPFLYTPRETQYYHKDFYDFMAEYNKLTFYLHLIFLLPVLFFLYVFSKEKKWNQLILLMSMSAICYYFILVSAVSFWQGDRLVLPSIAIWSSLYAFVLYHLYIQIGFWSKKLNISLFKNIKPH